MTQCYNLEDALFVLIETAYKHAEVAGESTYTPEAGHIRNAVEQVVLLCGRKDSMYVDLSKFMVDSERRRPKPRDVAKVEGMIATGEPYYILRGQDTFAPEVVLEHIHKMTRGMIGEAKVHSAMDVYFDMRKWQQHHGGKRPD